MRMMRLQQMSFLVQNQIDRAYIIRINQETRFLKYSKTDWPIEEVIRFASLIKIDEYVSRIIQAHGIDGQTLFNLAFLNSQLDLVLDQTKFLPIYKLFYIANAILNIDRQQTGQNAEQQIKQSFNSKHQNGLLLENEEEIEIDQIIIMRMKDQLQKLNNMAVIELSCNQIYRMIKNVDLMHLMDLPQEKAQSLKKWCVDGFSLTCIIASESENPIIRNYFSDEQMNFLKKLSHIFIHLYYYQYYQSLRSQNNTHTENSIDPFNIDFNQLNFINQFGEEGVKRSIGNSEYDVTDQQEYRNSQFRQSVAGSAIGVSQRGSVLGVSQRGSLAVSQRGSFMDSEYNVSERGSIKNSMLGSAYSSNQMEDDGQSRTTVTKQPKKLNANLTTSSIEDDSILKSLGQAALTLPFNLLNLQPLQKIKIVTMVYPFVLGKNNLVKKQTGQSEKSQAMTDLNSQRNETIYDWMNENLQTNQSKLFNLSGAKFGRSPENDFSYPDQLSISGKHAQIVFKDEAYYLRDLGSKTGTFLYISSMKPLILADQQIIQLSYEVQIKVVIVKNDVNEGVIKFQFKKPDNEPPYRAILKNNNTVRIGKAEKSHIRLTNQSISSYHAEIKYQQGKFIMYDCNTRTGTWLRLSSKGVRSADRKLTQYDIFRISSKKTFYIQHITEEICYEHNCHSTLLGA